MPNDQAAEALQQLHALSRELGRLRRLDDILEAIVRTAAHGSGKGLLSVYSAVGGLEVAARCGIEVARPADPRALHTTVIRMRQAEVLGLLSVHFHQSGLPTPCDVKLAEICAACAAIAIDAARAKERLTELERPRTEWRIRRNDQGARRGSP